MGYYIETPANTDKAQQMEVLHGAERLGSIPPSFDAVPHGKTLLCVVINPVFDAVGIVHDQNELAVFTDPYDHRPRTWMLLDTDKVVELAPRSAEVLLQKEEAGGT